MACLVHFSLMPAHIPGIEFVGAGKLFCFVSKKPPEEKYFKPAHYDPAAIPRKAVLTTMNTRLGHFVPIDGSLSVSCEIRDLIGGLEPSGCQFFPVQISRRHSSKPIWTRFGMQT